MKLTIEDNRETIKRYAHIKPAPLWGSVLCSVRCPGTPRICSLKRGHAGPHVSHGWFRRVVAVWDERSRIVPVGEAPKRAVRPAAPVVPRRRGFLATLRALRSLIKRREHVLEEVVFIVFALAMVGFAIHWIMIIFQ